jgi:choline kinase
VRGIVLAAGRGGRLRGVTGELPKCLTRIGSATLIERQIGELDELGVTPVTVVVGYRANAVRRVCDRCARRAGHGQLDFVRNARFASTNSLYSLWLARHLLGDGFVVLNCDVLFHRQLLEDLLTARYEDALLMDSRASRASRLARAPQAPREPDPPYSDEEMTIRVRGGRVVAMAKALTDADGENIGIAKFGRAGASVLIEELNRFVGVGARSDWLPAAFEAFCRRRPLHVVESRGFPWIEIDTPDDYWRACSEVLPAIDAINNPRQRPQAALDTAAVAGVRGGRVDTREQRENAHHV